MKIAKCCFTECNELAEWKMGTWQICDKHSEEWVFDKKEDEFGLWGNSIYGTCQRSGQENILAHNQRWNLPYIIEVENSDT